MITICEYRGTNDEINSGRIQNNLRCKGQGGKQINHLFSSTCVVTDVHVITLITNILFYFMELLVDVTYCSHVSCCILK